MTKHHVQAAQRHLKRINETAILLTPAKLHELDQKSRFLPTPDGYPTATLGDGGSRSSDPTTSVERAALAITDPSRRDPADNVGDSIRAIFVKLRQMSDLAASISREVGFVDHVRLKADGRQSTLAGECAACTEVVSGAEHDRLKSGFCPRCYTSLREEGMPDRSAWIVRRKAWLAGETEESA